ncbi:MAG: ATP-binding protein [Acidobacteriota bacterium]|nr:ATP-binding protein [Acidobacteriota bacterium]
MAPESIELIRKLSLDLQHRATEIEAIFDMLPVGISIADDPACRTIRFNRAFAEQVGLTEGTFATLHHPGLDSARFAVSKDGRPLPPEDRPMRLAARTARHINGVVVDVTRPDGRRVTLIENAAPLFDVDGRVRGAIGIFLDITDRHRVEREQRFLADASRVLSSSLDEQTTLRQLAHLAVPMLGDYCAVDVMREDGRFARVDFVVSDPEHAAAADVLRQYPPVLSVDSPAARAIRSGDPVVVDNVSSGVLERSAQSVEHLAAMTRFAPRAFMMVPLRARGRTLGLLTAGSLGERRYDAYDLALASDVASRAALALDNALLYRHAQDANRLKEDFLATLSHELRTPLNALLGWAHILKMPALDEASKKRALESIERNTNAQSVLINDLLDVSRVISGKLRLDVQTVDLAAVTLAAVDAARPAVRAKEIDLSVSLPSLAGELRGDADRLQQVIWNLLSNAVKFTPPGGRVSVSIRETGGAVQIVVADSGTGIDRGFLPHVFERFSQADSSTTRTHGGLGLGLAIVRHLVDLHGGAVTVDSDGPGAGAVFVVTLPTSRGAVTTVESPPLQEAMPRLEGVRVLAVDDEEDSRELILMSMRSAGAEVMVVSSAPGALAAFPVFSPHVVVTDLAMPGMDGYTLIREIESLAGQATPPVIALSAYTTAADVERATLAGFARHIGKPADYGALVASVAEVVKRSATG